MIISRQLLQISVLHLNDTRPNTLTIAESNVIHSIKTKYMCLSGIGLNIETLLFIYNSFNYS